jgi:hypothetical protein
LCVEKRKRGEKMEREKREERKREREKKRAKGLRWASSPSEPFFVWQNKKVKKRRRWGYEQ